MKPVWRLEHYLGDCGKNRYERTDNEDRKYCRAVTLFMSLKWQATHWACFRYIQEILIK